MRFTKLASAALASVIVGAIPVAGHAQDSKTLVGGFDVGPGGFPGSFNPLMATTGYMALTLFYEPLVVYDANLENAVGRLAEDYEVNEDSTVYTFHLVEDAVWHDGEAFTSEDVAFTLDLARSSASGSVFAARLEEIESVATPDEHTVVVNLSEANAAMLDTLTKVMMLPEHMLADVPEDTLSRNPYWTNEPVGTGPFEFERYETDQYVEYLANEDYYRGAPKLDRVVNRYFESTASAVSALKSDEIQVTYVDSDDLATFEGDDRFDIIESNSFVVNYLGFNFGTDLWDDVRVRQAVMHAIDRETIVQSLYDGRAEVANCGYVVDRFVPDDIDPYAYDPDRARKLLEEAGWDEINGDAPIEVLTYYNNPLSENVMGAMQAMLRQVGINIVPRVGDMGTYNSTIYAQNPDFDSFALVYAGLTNGPDPSNLNIGLNGGQIPPAGSNYTRADLPPVTEAFNTALGDPDTENYDANFAEVCRAMNENLPWATLWVTNRFGVASNQLEDFHWLPAPGGGPYESHPELWDIAE